MDLPRDEMAFRKAYQALVVDRQLTTVFRPGNRLYPNYRGYKLNEVITARIIETPGNDSDGIAPLFNDVKMPIQISDIEMLDIDELTQDHFDGSSPDVQSIVELRDHLRGIYGKPLSEYDNQVTRIQFTYVQVAQMA